MFYVWNCHCVHVYVLFFFLINGERNEEHLFDSECSG